MDPLPHVQAEQQANHKPPPSPNRPDIGDDEFVDEYQRLRGALMHGREAFTRALQSCEQDAAYGFDGDYVERQLKFAHDAVSYANISLTIVNHFIEFQVHAQEVEDDQERERDQSSNGQSVAAAEGGVS